MDAIILSATDGTATWTIADIDSTTCTTIGYDYDYQEAKLFQPPKEWRWFHSFASCAIPSSLIQKVISTSPIRRIKLYQSFMERMKWKRRRFVQMLYREVA